MTAIGPFLAGMALALLPTLAAADLRRVSTESDFVSLVAGRTLSTLGVKLEVAPDGAISGRAWGRDVTGAWRWQGRYFCRDLTFGEKLLAPNCQMVETDGETVLFTADEGRGDSARLRLR